VIQCDTDSDSDTVYCVYCDMKAGESSPKFVKLQDRATELQSWLKKAFNVLCVTSLSRNIINMANLVNFASRSYWKEKKKSWPEFQAGIRTHLLSTYKNHWSYEAEHYQVDHMKLNIIKLIIQSWTLSSWSHEAEHYQAEHYQVDHTKLNIIKLIIRSWTLSSWSYEAEHYQVDHTKLNIIKLITWSWTLSSWTLSSWTLSSWSHEADHMKLIT